MYEVLTENFNPYNISFQEESNIEVQVANNPTVRPIILEEFKQLCAAKLIDIMTRCWEHEARNRPSMDTILLALEEFAK